MRTPRGLALALAVVLGTCCCAGQARDRRAGDAPGASAAAIGRIAALPRATGADWPVYHADAARTGAVSGLPAAGALSVAWTRALDGAVYGQPLVIGGVVIAATENDSVYGLNGATGQVKWHVHLGTPVPVSALPCGNIDPLGITGTPAYDPGTGLVYVVAEETGYLHVLYGISLTGQVMVTRSLAAPDGQPKYDQQRPALAIAAGMVYVAFGGLFGDCGPYIGSMVGVPDSGTGSPVTFKVPTTRQGGIWATGGPVLGPSGNLYVSVGNGAAKSPPYDGSDSITELTTGLQQAGLFAPSRWATDNAGDLDLGSTTPALLASGDIVAVGKSGTGYLLNSASLGGIGGQLASAPVCVAFGGPAVSGTTAYIPCESGGMAAVDTSGGTLRVLWRGPAHAAGSPVVGGGAVWVASYGGTLFELDPATGHVRHSVRLGSPLPHFASPSLSGSLAFVGTTTGVTAVGGV
jgi:outer membrane protein assembly factor BamB